MVRHSGDKAQMDEVQAQYERWIYPAPIEDLKAWLANNGSSSGDPLDCGDMYWPATGYREGMEILVAGCGANQGARYALQHPTARVTAVDLSAASLAHEEKLKAKHGLDNLTLHQMRLEDIATLGKSFDFIASSGVLHHLPDPLAGLKALAGVLAPDGVIYLMLYARYGRAAVYMMQELFRIMDVGQTEQDLALVKDTLRALPPEHPLRAYEKRSTDMKFDAGLVDLFLHRQDRPYTVSEVLEFVRDGGLAFQGWVHPSLYNPDGAVPENHPLYQRLGGLPDEARWAAVELLGGTHGRHDFYICRTDRPAGNYRIDFDDPALTGRAVPVPTGSSLAPAAAGKPAMLTGPVRPPLTLPPPLVAIYGQIDGKRSIDDCLRSAPLDAPPEVVRQHGLRFFRSLWRTGHLAFRLKETS